MKALLKLFERLRPGFEKGGRFAAFHPVFDAAEHVFFATSARTKNSPHIRDPLDIKRFMSMVILALLPVLLAAKWCRPDRVKEFSESACLGGGLGRFPATQIMPLAMANALKLNKYGA